MNPTNVATAFSPETISAAAWVLGLLLGGTLIVSFFNGIMQAISFFKRPQTIESMFKEMDLRFDAKLEKLDERFEGKLEKIIGGVHAEVKERALHRDVVAMESRMFQQVESMKKDIGGRIDGMHASLVDERKTIQSISDDFNRAIGKLEGRSDEK